MGAEQAGTTPGHAWLCTMLGAKSKCSSSQPPQDVEKSICNASDTRKRSGERIQLPQPHSRSTGIEALHSLVGEQLRRRSLDRGMPQAEI